MRLLIAGAGGHGRVVADAALASGVYSSVSFLDDRQAGSSTAEGWSVIGSLCSMIGLVDRFDCFCAAFGNADLRLQVLQRAMALGFQARPVLHPSAVVSPFATIGPGTVVLGGAVVNVGARLQSGCIINTGASVDHDCFLDDGVHVCPGARLAGNVQVGRRVWFGIGALAIQGLRIGDDAVVGAGAVVIRDVLAGSTVVGNPARQVGQ